MCNIDNDILKVGRIFYQVFSLLTLAIKSLIKYWDHVIS